MNNKILIVEDEKDIRNLIIYALEGKGYQTISADDGEKAIKMLKENKPDLVILDWMLPSVSGLEICRSIRRDINTKNIPIIMLTAKITEEDKNLLEGIGNWLDVNGEAIFETETWDQYGEGRTKMNEAGPFSDNRAKLIYTAKDFRFTTKENFLYATALGWPS